MNRFQHITVILTLLTPGTSVHAAQCVTNEPMFVDLPSPFPTGAKWLGSENLAISAPLPGGYPGQVGKMWFSTHQPTRDNAFQVTLTRLDREVEPIIKTRGVSDGIPGLWGWYILLGFPSPGCWEVSGAYRSYVVKYTVDGLDTSHSHD